jgi:hypothetical protein
MAILSSTDKRGFGSTPGGRISPSQAQPSARYDQNVTTPNLPDDADPAACPLSLITSIAETARPDGDDLLGDRDDAAAWLRTARLLPPDAGLSGSEHNALLRLRDSLREVLAARADARLDADAAVRLTRALTDGRLVVTVDPFGTSGLASSARASYSNLVAAIAIAVAEAFRA